MTWKTMLAAAGMMVMTADADAMDRATRSAILDAARAPVTQALGKPVMFRVRQLRLEGRWVFLLAAMQDKAGHRLDYAGTPKAEAAAQGMVSDTYAALLRRDGERWTIVADAIGPTDMAWEGWAEKYGAAPSVFHP